MGFFKDMSDSAINFKQYRIFADMPWKRVISYFLIMVLILGLPVLFSIAYDFQREMTDRINDFIRTAPDFVLKNGELTVAGEMPLVYESENQGERYVIFIDTTGENDSSVLDDHKHGIFISKTKIVMKQSSLESQEYHFSALQDLKMDKSDVTNMLSYLRPLSLLIIFLGLIYFFFAKLCTVAVLGFVTLLFSGMQNCGLQYGQAFKVTVFAITIPTLFQSLHNIIAPGFVYGWSIYYSIALIYLWFAVRAIRKQSLEGDDTLTV